MPVWWRRPRLWSIVLLVVAAAGLVALTRFLLGRSLGDAVNWLTVIGGYIAMIALIGPAAVALWQRGTTTALAGAPRGRIGRRVREVTPDELEVRAPVEVPGHQLPDQTAYVRRAHDDRLDAAVRQVVGGTSRMVTLVGDSSTGKTRACMEAVQELPGRWRLWHPIDPSRPEAALESLAHVSPRTVVWMNDAHHYLATPDPEMGEHVAAGLRSLLTDRKRAPVLILTTLWPQFWRQLTTTPDDGQPDPYAQARELLAGTEIPVPAAFTGNDLAAVRLAAADDRRLTVAVREAADGRIAQYLAGVPELLRRYRTATPPARAVLDAAIDARRLGHPVHLSVALLQKAASGYLSEVDRITLHRDHGNDWFDHVIDDLDRPQRGISGPLTRIRTDEPLLLRLADAIEQAGTTERAANFPPVAFWNAIATAITDPSVLTAFADQAERRGRYRRANQLYRLAIYQGDTTALVRLAAIRERAGDHAGAEQLLREAANHGRTVALRGWVGTEEVTTAFGQLAIL